MQQHLLPTLNRVSEQEEDDDDADDDDDDDDGGGDYDNHASFDDMLDNVSRNTATTSSEFKCHSGPGDSKFNTYSYTPDTMLPHVNDSLRKRCNAANSTAKTNKSKCVQFIKLPKRNDDDSPRSTIYSPAELNEHHSKPLKKIIFNGTFPIDDPYSSRF